MMNKLIVANWKQNKSLEQVKSWIKDFKSLVDGGGVSNVDVVICPSYPYLEIVSDFAKDYAWIFVGAQNVSRKDSGSYTGEVGAGQIKDFVDFCIVGHSERSETSEIVVEKIDRCLENSITPIICFEDEAFLSKYKEPSAYYLWEDPATISKGGSFKPKPLDEIKKGVDKIVNNHSVGKGLLYGGSINKDNSSGLSKVNNLSGGVSGSASLDPQHFYKIIKSFESINALR